MLQPSPVPAIPFAERLRTGAGRRALGIGLALLVEGLLLLMLLSLNAGDLTGVKEGKRITVVNLSAEAASEEAPEPNPAEPEQPAQERPAPQRPATEEPPPPRPAEPKPVPVPMIKTPLPQPPAAIPASPARPAPPAQGLWAAGQRWFRRLPRHRAGGNGAQWRAALCGGLVSRAEL